MSKYPRVLRRIEFVPVQLHVYAHIMHTELYRRMRAQISVLFANAEILCKLIIYLDGMLYYYNNNNNW